MNISPKKHREWLYLRDDVMATNFYEGMALLYFLALLKRQPQKAICYEVADLQQYKMHRKQAAALSAAKQAGKEPFVFVLWKN